MKETFDREDAITTLLESYRERESDDAVYESRQRFLEDDNYLDVEEEERGRLQDLTDDELQDELQEMLATEFGHNLKSLVGFMQSLTEAGFAKVRAKIEADDNLRCKVEEVVELTKRLVGGALETQEVQLPIWRCC